MNYTNSNDLEYKDTPEDWLNSALIFTRALSFLLNENEGIVVDIKGDAKFMPDKNISKVVVFKRNSQIVIDECDKSVIEGTMCFIETDN